MNFVIPEKKAVTQTVYVHHSFLGAVQTLSYACDITLSYAVDILHANGYNLDNVPASRDLGKLIRQFYVQNGL